MPDKLQFEENFVKFLLLKTRVGQAIASVLLMSVIACSLSQQSTTSGVSGGSEFSQTTAPQSLARETISSNLVALFLVKKDNLKNEFRGEVYPIALMLNDRYLEISNDVTGDIRNDASRDRIIQMNNQRIVFNAIKNFTVISDNQKLGEFQVEKPIVSQFACSSIITGQGSFQGQTSLQTVFAQIPQKRSGRFTGYVGNQRFNEIWRTAIAISQAPSLSKPPAASEADLARYRQTVLTFGKAAIAQVSNGKPVPDEVVVESIRVVDLNQDGSPEIFGKVKQKNATNVNASQQLDPIGFATVWLTYKDGKPQLLETTQAAVSLLGSQRSPSDLLETIDINGDGIDEAIIKRTGYESTSFEIYEYKNNQLNRVFSGAGYGC
ncbi:MAG: hypothetical protein C6Y22_30410 [Hapalosiphonaceae cyanobacterium JJU2]|nr:MAG: hypothetical protein C6Y22_30410 [Hapalosiphonaceae cyanobacterium JJU2]